MHEIVWIDLTKCGRVSTGTLSEIADSLKALLRNGRTAAVVIAPMLATAGVKHGLRGESRRLEDKFDSKDLRSHPITIRAQSGT